MSRPSLSSLTATPSPLLVLLNAFVCMQGLADNLLCGLEHRIRLTESFAHVATASCHADAERVGSAPRQHFWRWR